MTGVVRVLRGGPITAALPWVVLAASLAAAVAVRAAVPPVVLGNALYDDQLLVRLASSLGRGEWLGAFDRLTLSKGAGYPLFLAGTSGAGVPLPLAEGLLRGFAGLLVALAAVRVGAGSWVSVAAGALVALDPAFLGSEAARVHRSGFYASVCIALLAAAVLAVAPVRRSAGQGPVLAARIGWGALAGVLGFFYWTTREERPWLLPSLVLVVAGLLVAAVVEGRRRRADGVAAWRWVVPPVLGVVVAVGVAAGGVGLLADRNADAYGHRGVTDFAEGGYAELYAALSAVDVAQPRHFVPITQEQRAAAYAASPEFARLEGGIETDWRDWGLGASCPAVGVCDDYAGGWMPWVLRGAVEDELGPPMTGADFQDFTGRAAAEVRAGCAVDYPCRSSPASFLPDLRAVPEGQLVSSTVGAAVTVVGFRTGDTWRPPVGPEEWDVYADTVVGVAAEQGQHPAAPPRVVEVWRDAAERGYGLLFVVLGLPAALGAVAGLFVARTRLVALLSAAALGAAAARVLLMALVDASSFPAVDGRGGYLLPAYDPAVVGVVLGVAALVGVVATVKDRHGDGSTASPAAERDASHASTLSSGTRAWFHASGSKATGAPTTSEAGRSRTSTRRSSAARAAIPSASPWGRSS